MGWGRPGYGRSRVVAGPAASWVGGGWAGGLLARQAREVMTSSEWRRVRDVSEVGTRCARDVRGA